MRVVGKLKAALWPITQRQGFFVELPAVLELVQVGRYGFYAFLVGITYMAYGKYGYNFIYAFPAAYFIGMIYEEGYNLIKVYKQQITTKRLFAMIAWSLFCVIAATAMVVILMKQFGYTGQAATITSVLVVKLMQPLGSRRFIILL